MDNRQLRDTEIFEPKDMNSITHALDVLNNAAKESSTEIREMINKDYGRIKDTLSEVKPEVKGALREIREASQESLTHARDRVIDLTKQTANKVDKSAHDHPWSFIAGSALAACLVGIFLSRKTQR